MTFNPSVRSKFTARKAYNRPLNEDEDRFETWEDTVSRVIVHQAWLWERAKGDELNQGEIEELEELRELHLSRKATLAGRTLWIGGTDISRTREVSNFNCSFTEVATVYDLVDVFWSLLNGSGVGFKPKNGILNGFRDYIPNIEILRSECTDKGGRETNLESWDTVTKHWTISVGDSAEAWARALGKLIAGKYPADTLTIDLREIRPAGKRLKGYGWICSGDRQLADAMRKIAELMNRRAGSLLTKIDIMDIVNLMGTVLSSRRSAEICLMDYDDPEAHEFVTAKKDYYLKGLDHRSQSNNSIVFWRQPSKRELRHIFDTMLECGGSEPGLINGEQAAARAPWFAGLNPCLAGDTLVPTDDGIKRIDELAGSSHVIWDGEGNKVKAKFEQTSPSASVIKVSLSDGSDITCTPNHRFVLDDGTFIRADKLTKGAKLKPAYITDKIGREISVESVTPLEQRIPVYCAGVPTTGSFDLTNVHSGNCGEILLPNKGLCNLASIDLQKFKGDTQGLHRAAHLIARANYRQTLVNLDDGVLQEAWHLNNEFLRLCGVSLAGVVTRDDMKSYEYQQLQRTVTSAAYGMADELGMQRPKNVTTIKPDGTFSKIADTTAGVHRPMGRFIFNNIGLSIHDPMVQKMKDAGYRVFEKPGEPETALVTIPVDEGSNIQFDKDDQGKEVNLESAWEQLERYRKLQRNWTQQNTSVTIYYDPEEIPDIVVWMYSYWNDYVGVSFLLRPDPTKTAADLGFPYLPQEVVDGETFANYVSGLSEVSFDDMSNESDLDMPDENCAGGACPVR